MAIVYKNKEYRNLQEQVLENAKNIEILKERPTLKPVVVQELPATGEVNILYLVPKNPDPDTSDADSYDEYVWLPETQTYEFVGSTALNLQQLPSPIYVTTSEKPEGLTYGLRIQNNGWTSEIQQEGGAKIDLTGTAVNVTATDGVNTSAINSSSELGLFGYVGTNTTGFTLGNGIIQANRNITPTTDGGRDLGSNTIRWKDLHLAGQINFSAGPSIKQDSSNRIIITGANGADRIKIGGETSTYCAASWTPDEDNKYLLGTGTLRWKSISVATIINANGNLTLRGNPDVTVILGNRDSEGAMIPSGNNKNNFGSTTRLWKAVYTKTIGDDTNSVNVADIATKPNFDSPTVYASGTIDGNGQFTVDMETLGVPAPGLYALHYLGAQCYVTFTTENIQNAGTTPIIVSCPVLKDGIQYAGWLKITRATNTLTFTIESSAGPASPQSMPWSIYKVM